MTLDLERLAQELRAAGYDAASTMEDCDRNEWERIEWVVAVTHPRIEVYDTGHIY